MIGPSEHYSFVHQNNTNIRIKAYNLESPSAAAVHATAICFGTLCGVEHRDNADMQCDTTIVDQPDRVIL